MKRCFALNELAFPIALDQTGRDKFTVTYGKQVRAGLDYAQAAHEFGLCVMHALACDGLLDTGR